MGNEGKRMVPVNFGINATVQDRFFRADRYNAGSDSKSLNYLPTVNQGTSSSEV